MRRINAVVCITSFTGLLLAGAIGCVLRHYTNWHLDVTAETVRSLLLTIIQAQATILAMAVSFSLLYVQISTDIYSLRVGYQLMRQRAFAQMIGFYSLSLAFNGALVLIVTTFPTYLPSVLGGVAVVTLVSGIAVLVRYIASVLQHITPEALVKDLTQRIDPKRLETEALAAIGGDHATGISYLPEWLPNCLVPTSMAALAGSGRDISIPSPLCGVDSAQ